MQLFLTALLTPDLGLIFWTTIAFFLFLFLLAKYAWKPLLRGVKNREKLISDALKNAQRVERDVVNAKEECARLIAEAEAECRKILSEAEALRLKMIDTTRKETRLAAEVILEKARKDAEAQQVYALEQMKDDIVTMIVEVAEKVLMRELKDKKKEELYVSTLLKEITTS